MSALHRFAPVVLAILTTSAAAHPSSGIVVDKDGNVFIADLSRGLLKIDPKGKVSTVNKEAGHWLGLDRDGAFAGVDFQKSAHWPRWFKRRTPADGRPVLITDGGSPLVVSADGSLYFVCGGDRFVPGGHRIARLTPDGKLSLLTPDLRKKSEELGGIKGLAVGPDDSFYITYPGAVFQVAKDGKVTALANPVVVEDCDKHPENIKDAPHLRGLTVDTRGNVYVAATGCRRIVKITPQGRVTVVLKSEAPWSPSGVALDNEDLYVLEHVNGNSEAHEDWAPRVRKLAPDGKVTILARFFDPKR